jgi:hypothetical protein
VQLAQYDSPILHVRNAQGCEECRFSRETMSVSIKNDWRKTAANARDEQEYAQSGAEWRLVPQNMDPAPDPSFGIKERM